MLKTIGLKNMIRTNIKSVISELFEAAESAKAFTIDGDKGKICTYNGQRSLYSTDALGVPGYILESDIVNVAREKNTFTVKLLINRNPNVLTTCVIKIKK